MAEHSGPFSSGAGLSVDQWSSMMATFFGFGASTTGIFGVAGDPGSTDLQCFGDASGMQVKLPIGSGIVDGQWYNNDAQQTIAIGANSSGNPRIDRLVIRRIVGTPGCFATIIVGTPGATPAPPALTNQDLQIAQIVVANGAVTITAGNVIDERIFVPRGVQPITVSNSKPSAPFFGQLVAQNGALLFWDGVEWEQINYDSGWASLPTNRSAGHGWIPVPGFPTLIRRYGELVRITGQVTQGSAAPLQIAPAGSVPVGMRPAAQTSYVCQSTGGVVVTVFILTDGSITLATSGFVNGAVAVGDTLPLDGGWLVS